MKLSRISILLTFWFSLHWHCVQFRGKNKPWINILELFNKKVLSNNIWQLCLYTHWLTYVRKWDKTFASCMNKHMLKAKLSLRKSQKSPLKCAHSSMTRRIVLIFSQNVSIMLMIISDVNSFNKIVGFYHFWRPEHNS